MKKIKSYQWLSECGKFGIEKVAVNDNETKFKYNVCEVFEQYGTKDFQAFETCELLRDAKEYAKGLV
tara:strand:- start:380 stop:580 length:201 start_codon:yes stop_codon:yes gene_type:complete